MSHDVIVCIHNGHDDVKECIDSIIRHWDRDTLSRLILVDDFSDARMREMLDSYKEKYDIITVINLKEQNYYTKAANVGLKASNSKIKTLVNSDTIVTHGWEKRVQALFGLSSTVGIVGPLSNAASTQSVPFVKSTKTQTAINTLPPGVSIDEFAEFIKAEAAGIVRPFVPLVHGFCLSLTQDVIDEIGYFDEESFPKGYGEENDFCFRAEDAGFVLAIAVDTFIFHAKSKSYTSDDRVANMNNGMKKFAEKHGVDRIKSAIQYMENHPSLQEIRSRVLNRWADHYQA